MRKPEYRIFYRTLTNGVRESLARSDAHPPCNSCPIWSVCEKRVTRVPAGVTLLLVSSSSRLPVRRSSSPLLRQSASTPMPPSAMTSVSSLLSAGPVPQLFVFDIDFTLWRAHVDCTAGPPFRLDPHTPDAAQDRWGESLHLFPHTRPILDELRMCGAKMAAASRTTTPDWSRDLLGKLGLVAYFDSEHMMQIYPGRKIDHFRRLKEASGVEYSHMIFFDDEYHNIQDISKLGVTCVYVQREGLCYDIFREGIVSFREKVATAA